MELQEEGPARIHGRALHFPWVGGGEGQAPASYSDQHVTSDLLMSLPAFSDCGDGDALAK